MTEILVETEADRDLPARYNYGLFGSAHLSPADGQITDYSAPLRVPRGSIVLARVEVGGSRGWFILDTGSRITLVSAEMGARLRPCGRRSRLSSFSCGDRIDLGKVKSENIRFAGSRLKYPEEVSVLDLGFLEPLLGMRVDGILGWDVLREYVVGIDVRGARLVAGRDLSPNAVLETLGVSRTCEPLTLETTWERPFVTAHGGSQSLRLGLDTGSEYTVLSRSAFVRLGLELPESSVRTITRAVNCETSGRMARLAELRLGQIVWTDIEVVVEDSAYSSDQVAGLLGMDLLSDYLIVVDGPSRRLFLAKRASGRE